MSPARRALQARVRALLPCRELNTERCVPCVEPAPPRGPEHQPGGLWGPFDPEPGAGVADG